MQKRNPQKNKEKQVKSTKENQKLKVLRKNSEKHHDENKRWDDV